MSDPIAAQDPKMDIEKAVTLSAVAAMNWLSRQERSDAASPGGSLFAELDAATSWANRARIAAGELEVLTIDNLIAAWSLPAASWLPGAIEEPLICEGMATPVCIELADTAGSNPGAEVEQRIMAEARSRLAARADGAERYTLLRRFIVQHATVEELEAHDVCLKLGLVVSNFYERVGPECCVVRGGVDCYFACPRCGWSMPTRGERVLCAGEACQRAGARFRIVGDQLLALGPVAAPQAIAVEGQRRLCFGLWRYTVLPGLEELELAEALRRLNGTTVEMWPELDAYDLDVRRGGERWRVDVKDYASARRLAERLLAQPPARDLHIVVPDCRQHQLPLLRTACASVAQLRFHSASDFIRCVREAVL